MEDERSLVECITFILILTQTVAGEKNHRFAINRSCVMFNGARKEEKIESRVRSIIFNPLVSTSPPSLLS